VCEFDFPRKEF